MDVYVVEKGVVGVGGQAGRIDDTQERTHIHAHLLGTRRPGGAEEEDGVEEAAQGLACVHGPEFLWWGVGRVVDGWVRAWVGKGVLWLVDGCTHTRNTQANLRIAPTIPLSPSHHIQRTYHLPQHMLLVVHASSLPFFPPL